MADEHLTAEELRSELERAARWGRFRDLEAPREARRLVAEGRAREAFDLLDATALSPPSEDFAWLSMRDAAQALG
ncbi:MAG: hypothetical protein LC790_14775, partial [Actinobacteria bacterium]|nr:hypothetical protein [Actinomycetota bacterium]MCA1700092.1 hypothetical protein [Actinomycetota bacterium]